MSTLQSDSFWLSNPMVLIEPSRLIEFWPTHDMTTDEKCNALTRLALYSGVIGAVVIKSPNPVYWTMAIIILLALIDGSVSKKSTSPVQLIEQMDPNDDPDFSEDCEVPTKENPFMNYLLFENEDRSPACRGPGVDKVALNLFNDTIFRDVDDLYGRNQNWRDFYTQPNTTNPNDRESYLRWLFFSQTDNCKSNPDSLDCTPWNDVMQGRRSYNDSVKIAAGRADNSANSFPQSYETQMKRQASIQKS